MALLWSLSEAKALNKAMRGQKYTFFSNMKNEFTNFWRVWHKNAIFFTDAYFRVLFERLYVHWGGVANVPPLYVATPTFYSHAHKDFSMFQWIFAYASIDRSRIGLLGFQRGPGLCRSGLEGVTFVGMALASIASYGHAHKGHAIAS